ncbi:MAG: tetratricopeptide repeat protein [Planctomycetota bacterium]|nr:tetratricopeptide repeat protein [Planctomycetota bacterium]
MNRPEPPHSFDPPLGDDPDPWKPRIKRPRTEIGSPASIDSVSGSAVNSSPNAPATPKSESPRPSPPKTPESSEPKSLADQLPTPIALPLQQADRADSPRVQLDAIFLAFHNFHRLIGVIQLARYLRSPENIPSLSDLVTNLRSASTSSWQEFLTHASKVFPGEDPIGQTTSGFLNRAETECLMVIQDVIEGKHQRDELGLISHFIHFIHTSSTGLLHLPARRLRDHARFARDLLDQILNEAHFLTRFQLIQIPRADEKEPVRLLRGSDPWEPSQPFESSTLPGDLGPGLYWHDSQTHHFLSLHPLAIALPQFSPNQSPSQDSSSPNYEVFFYEGHSSQRVHYQGQDKRIVLREYRQDYAKLLTGKGLESRSGTAETSSEFLAAIHSWTQHELDRIPAPLGGRFVGRQDPIASLNHFVHLNHSVAFLLCSEPGMGKTTLLSTLAAQWQEEGHGVFFLDMDQKENPDPRRPLAQLLRNPERLESTLNSVVRDLGPSGNRLVLLIDHIDRTCPDPQFPARLSSFLSELRHYQPVVKVVLALRSAHLDRFQVAFRDLPDNLFAQRSPRHLHRLSSPEREALYENLRSHSTQRPITPYYLLRERAKSLISHPDLARVLASTYAGKEIPERLSLESLLEDFCRRRIFCDRPRRHFVRSFLKLLFNARHESISFDELLEQGSSTVVDSILDSGIGNRSASPLIDNGSLERQRIRQGAEEIELVRFSSPSILHYLLYLQESRDRPFDLPKLEANIKSQPTDTYFDGLLVHILLSLISLNEHPFSQQILTNAHPSLIQALLRLARSADLYSTRPKVRNAQIKDILLEAILKNPSASIYPILFVFLDQKDKAGNPEEAAQLCERALPIFRNHFPFPEDEALLTARAGRAHSQAKDFRRAARRFKDAIKLYRKGDRAPEAALLHLDLAQIEEELDRPRKALSWIERGRELLQSSAPLSQALPFYHALFHHETKHGSPEKSFDHLSAALDIALSANIPEEIARCYRNGAQLEETLHHPERALNFLRKYEQLAQETNDLSWLADANHRMSEVLRGAGRSADSLAASQRGIDFQSRLGSGTELGTMILSHAKTLQEIESFDHALVEYKKAAQIFELGRDTVNLSTAIHQSGNVHYEMGNEDLALEAYGKALEYRKRIQDNRGIAGLYHNIGILYRGRGDLGRALEYYNRSLAIKEELEDAPGLAHTYAAVALVHAAQKDFVAAHKEIDRAFDLSAQGGSPQDRANCLTSKGLLLAREERYEEAIQCQEEAAEILREAGDLRGLSASYNNIALVQQSRGDDYGALKIFEKAAEIQDRIGDQRGLAATCNNIGVIHDSRGQYEKALHYYKKDLQITKNLGDPQGLATSYHNIAILHFSNRNYPKALLNLERCLPIYENLDLSEEVAAVHKKIEMVRKQM